MFKLGDLVVLGNLTFKNLMKTGIILNLKSYHGSNEKVLRILTEKNDSSRFPRMLYTSLYRLCFLNRVP